MAGGGIGNMVEQSQQFFNQRLGQPNQSLPSYSQNNTQTSGQGQMQPPQGGNLQGGGSPFGYGGMGGYGGGLGGYGYGGMNQYQQQPPQQTTQQQAAPDWQQSDEWKGYQTQRSDLQKQLEASDAWKGMQNLQTQMQTYQQAHVPQQQPRYGGGYGGNYGGGIGYPGMLYKNGGKV